MSTNILVIAETRDGAIKGITKEAVTCAVDAVDRLQTTAESHDRVMVLEVMGRYAGWIAIFAGVAGGADVIFIPEIPFTHESVCAQIARREAVGKEFTIVVAAEGAKPVGGEFVGDTCVAGEARLGGVGAVVAAEIAKLLGALDRADVIRAALAGHGMIVLAADRDDALLVPLAGHPNPTPIQVHVVLVDADFGIRVDDPDGRHRRPDLAGGSRAGAGGWQSAGEQSQDGE